MIILIMPTKLVLHEDRIFYFSIFRMFHDTSVEENLTFHNWFQESFQHPEIEPEIEMYPPPHEVGGCRE